MVGIVLVSHSRKLVKGIKEILDQMNHKGIPIALAGGIENSESPIGTEATSVLNAIESCLNHENNNQDGVIVFMDLGSAIMSAETAIEMLDENVKSRVVMTHYPIVEGAFLSMFLSMEGKKLKDIKNNLNECLFAKKQSIDNYYKNT